ncbi:alpha/beta hydrolase [Cryobacterium sp. MLB-32]|uniref:alpha/beta hydrolase n=1 Tax=Cryobacterium sp. MLB-32 TaxID=1529318 RepID=UPI00068EC031|nr:alpha/beta hydrolase [Cryobacterium sp. MLB-32]
MTTGSRFTRFGTTRLRLLAILGAVALASALTVAGVGLANDTARTDGTDTSATEPTIGIRTFDVPMGITVTPDVAYGTGPEGTPLRLDVCSTAPAGSAPRPAVVSVHGGSWTRGDKSSDDWRQVCEWLASEGFVAYSVDYGLTPEAPFPAAIDDLHSAVEWIRAPENADRFGIDADRIGAFGGSAGGNLAALLGTRGNGPLTEGSRVAAVAELSGPSDLRGPSMTTDGVSQRLQNLVLRYLDCETMSDCPQAAGASPVATVDSSDPPFFIVNSVKEFVPLTQATRFASALEKAGVRHELVTVPGGVHSIGLLDADMRARVAAFLHSTLGT